MSPNVVPLASLLAALSAAVVGAFFAGADTALTSLSATRLGALIEQAAGWHKRALERIQRDDARIRSRYLLGRVLCSALTAVFMVDVLRPFSPELAPYLGCLAAALVAGTLFEIATTLAKKHADRVAPVAARYMRPLEIMLLPLAIPLGWIGGALGRKDGEAPSDPRVTGTEVEMMVDEVERAGLFGREPAEMIRNVLEFVDRTARDVKVPRSKVEAIELSTPLEKVLEIVTESGHSRYPVYKDQIDNVVGLLYAKDLFRIMEEHRLKKTSLKDIIRSPANFVAESQPLSSLLREMRARRQHLAIVVDEFGGVSGIITLEDILEEIVGDIRDEHDTEEAPIQDLGDGRVVADGGTSISDLSAYLGTDIQDGGTNQSIEAMLTEHLGKIPEAGTAISKYGLRFTVRDSDDKRVGKVEIVRA